MAARRPIPNFQLAEAEDIVNSYMASQAPLVVDARSRASRQFASENAELAQLFPSGSTSASGVTSP